MDVVSMVRTLEKTERAADSYIGWIDNSGAIGFSTSGAAVRIVGLRFAIYCVFVIALEILDGR